MKQLYPLSVGRGAIANRQQAIPAQPYATVERSAAVG